MSYDKLLKRNKYLQILSLIFASPGFEPGPSRIRVGNCTTRPSLLVFFDAG